MNNSEEESGIESSSTLPPDTKLFKYMLENAEIDYIKSTSIENGIDVEIFELETGLRAVFDGSGSLMSFESS